MQEPLEGNTAEAVGLSSGAPDGTVVLLQLPPMLPAMPLAEAAQRRASGDVAGGAAAAAVAEGGAGARPALSEMTGPEVMAALPNGKVCFAAARTLDLHPGFLICSCRTRYTRRSCSHMPQCPADRRRAGD